MYDRIFRSDISAIMKVEYVSSFSIIYDTPRLCVLYSNSIFPYIERLLFV